MATITIDWDSPDATFDTIYDLNVGDVFKFTKDIETLNTKVQTRVPVTLSKFSIRIITPGSAYWTIYGVNSFIVTEKVIAPTP